MTKYSTGNPVGSADPRDLYDTATVADKLVQGADAAYPDRLGVSRRSWKSVEAQADQQAADFDADQADRAQRFNDFLASSGYEFAGDYAAGIEITEYNQVIRDTTGEFWRASGSTTLPYTTTGAGLPEGGAFVAVGDAVLRQELAGDPASGQGAALVSGAAIYVGSVAESFFGIDGNDGQEYSAIAWHPGGAAVLRPTGGGNFVFKSGVSKAEHNGGTIISPTVPPVSAQAGAASHDRVENFLNGTGETDPSGNGVFIKTVFDDNDIYEYGAIGNDATYDNWPSINAAVNRTVREQATTIRYAGRIYVPESVFHLNRTLNLKTVVLIEGNSSGMELDASVLQFGSSITNGIVFNRAETIDNTIEAAPSGRADGSIMRGISVFGPGVGAGSQGHGIRLRCRAVVENCHVAAFQEDGINVVAAATSSVESNRGNANNFRIVNCRINSNGGNGVFTNLADANAGAIVGVDSSNNGGWGFYDSSFLGNSYVGCHTDDNALGGYKTDNPNARNVFLGCYTEPPQQSDVVKPSIVIGGLFGANNGNAARLRDSVFENLDTVGAGAISSTRNASGYASGLSVWNQIAMTGSAGTGIDFEQGPEGASEKTGKIRSRAQAASPGSGRHAIGLQIYDGAAEAYETAIEAVGSINAVVPGPDNIWALGSASARWAEVFAANATINTSDEREKQQVRELSDAEKRVGITLKSKIRAFKWNAAVEEKGGKARIHFGVIAQEVGDAFRAEGLDPEEYGMFCFDEWEEVPEVIEDYEAEYDKHGNLTKEAGSRVVQKFEAAGNRYGVRYEELMAFIISAL